MNWLEILLRRIPSRLRFNGNSQTARSYRPGRKLFIATHKAFAPPSGNDYVPIHAGKANSSQDFGFIGDDTGDHISNKNPYFCELTVLYWIWRNIDCDQVGLMHYRRFLAGHHRFDAVADTPIAACDDFHELDSGYNLVVPRSINFGSMSVEQQYLSCCHANDLLSVRRAISSLHRDYVEAYDFVMRNNNLICCNVFVGRKHIIDQYCAWLFEILFHVAKTSPHESYEQYHQRVFGFLAERLFNVWVAQNWNDLRIAYRPIVDITR